MRTIQKYVSVLAVMLVLVLSNACAGKRAPILVAQAGEAAATTVGQLQVAAIDLEKQGALPTANALKFQENLLAVNRQIAKLPPMLKALDAAQQANAGIDQAAIEEALNIVESVSGDLSVVIGGVPVTDATKQLLELVRATQKTITTVTVELARLQERTK